jgi:hypothetical protein
MSWSFTTIQFKPPGVTYLYNGEYYRLLVKANDVVGTHPADGGVENTDYVVVTYLPNVIRTKRVLCACAENRFFYETIT